MDIARGKKRFNGESGESYEFAVFDLEGELRRPEGWDYKSVVFMFTKCDLKKISGDHEIILLDETDDLGHQFRNLRELPIYLDAGANALCIMMQENIGFRTKIKKDLFHLQK